MKIDKFDIGAEILSILTKGMYPDPRDVIREYIQNSIDAKSPSLSIKVRPNSVVIEDVGIGMDYGTLRRAIRIGVSDKRPGKDVGFMGIGIYSAFHLCDTLTIFTRQASQLPQMLTMDFRGMRLLLEGEREKRLSGIITSEQLTDLQTLLSKHIQMTGESGLALDEYPVDSGTRVELVGLNPLLDDLLNKFDELAKYLSEVVPLPFNKNAFKWSNLITEKINEICTKHNAKFELVSLTLQVGSKKEVLYRPYRDIDFNGKSPLSPEFVEIMQGGTFYGVAWGCLNSYDKARTRIFNKDLRGFLLKKQGFSIGKRENLARLFGASNTHFDRYTGEIIITHQEILPNASRNELEASSLRTALYYLIQSNVAPKFNAVSTKYQEVEKAKGVLEEQGNALKKVLVDFSPNIDNYNLLVPMLAECAQIKKKLDKKRLSNLDELDKKEAEKIRDSATRLEKEIALKFQELSKPISKRATTKPTGASLAIAKQLESYTAQEVTTKFESLIDLVEALELDYDSRMKELLVLIDDRFVQGLASSKIDYYMLLNELRNEFDNL